MTKVTNSEGVLDYPGGPPLIPCALKVKHAFWLEARRGMAGGGSRKMGSVGSIGSKMQVPWKEAGSS